MPYTEPQRLSDVTPSPEATAPAAGAMDSASRADHKHPRLTSVTNHTLGSNGEVTVTFTQEFDVQPGIDFTYTEAADNPPVVFKVKSWVITSGKYTGCVVKGYRGQTIPQNLVALLVGAVYNVFGGSAVGVSFSCVAIKSSV